MCALARPAGFASESIVITHSFIGCNDSLLGYARPEHLKTAVPVLFRFGSVRYRKVYRRLYQCRQRLRDQFHRNIIPKDMLSIASRIMVWNSTNGALPASLDSLVSV